jgi:hypothetical protein
MYDDGDYEDEEDEEDDEIMAAQRAEFAALWGISLTDMVDQKEDRDFFELISKVQVWNSSPEPSPSPFTAVYLSSSSNSSLRL